MNLLKKARKSDENGNLPYKDSTKETINLITVNKPEESYLKESIVNMQIQKNKTIHLRVMVKYFWIIISIKFRVLKKARWRRVKVWWILLTKIGNDEDHNTTSGNKSNDVYTSIGKNGRIQIVNKRKGERCSSQIIVCPQKF